MKIQQFHFETGEKNGKNNIKIVLLTTKISTSENYAHRQETGAVL